MLVKLSAPVYILKLIHTAIIFIVSIDHNRLELHLVGGFADDQKHSEKLSREILCKYLVSWFRN